MKIENGDDYWEYIWIPDGENDLKFSSRQFQKPQDPFSKMRLGLWNYFDKIQTNSTLSKDKVNQGIGDCFFAIGVVSYTQFTQKGIDLLYKLTEINKGMIFTGSAMLNEKGQLLLDADGNSEV